MELFKRIPISFDGKEYEIRVLHDDGKVNVVAFLGNHPANGYRHQILLPKQCDMQKALGGGIAEDLVEMSKRDITERKWERIREALG